jgi:RHS repeat-associated protein
MAIASFYLGFTIVAPCVFAQDQNITSGLQSNHPFETGKFGEDIDVLNGGLTMSVPIGQEYLVSSNLKYQVALRYNSRVWDTSDWGQFNVVHLAHVSNMGLGFSFNFGRIYRDVTLGTVRSGNTTNPMTFYTWVYVSPDGSEHEIGSAAQDSGGCTRLPEFQTIDTTFYSISWSSSLSTWNGTSGTAPTFSVSTPEGIRYTFAQVVQAFDSGGLPYNRASSCSSNGWDPKWRDYNRDFGGWYVTLIEDTKSDWSVVNDPNSPRNGQPGYAAWVEIAYDTRGGFEHAISSMRDSAGRHLVFNNDCERDAGGQCRFTAGEPTPPQRHSVRTQSIEVPAFAGNAGPVDATRAVYNFVYQYTSTSNLVGGTAPAATNFLSRVDFPTVTPRSAGPYHFSLGLTYSNYGELQSRNLPTGATDIYYWGSYVYTASSGRGGYLDEVASGFSRELTRVQRFLDASDPNAPVGDWTYTRTGSSSATNPKQVVIRDPAGNETVYYFHGSYPESNLYFDRSNLDDGFAPEWDDGLNYRVETYQGNGPTRKLLRTVTRDYEYDQITVAGNPGRKDPRMNREATIYQDDSGRQAVIAYSGWNFQGLWRITKESGFDIPATRTTRTEYTDRDPTHFTLQEVSDGTRVIKRQDRFYTGTRLAYTIDRLTLPVAIGTGQDTTALAGDVVTGYSYDSLGNISEKQIGDSGVNAGGQGGYVSSPDYRTSYTWQAGGYQASERSFDRVANQFYTWKSRDLSLDGNTGLPFQSRDPAGFTNQHVFDLLGRPTYYLPPAPEFPYEFDYPDAKHVVMRRGDPAVMGSNFTCSGATTLDFQMQCGEYDNLGLMAKMQTRPQDPTRGFPYQKTDHDIMGRVTFVSEWLWPGSPVVGTTFDYTDPANPSQSDPFDRPRKITRADGKFVERSYFGLNTRVTRHGVRGTSGLLFDPVTTYFRDGWNRLVYVQMPIGGGASAAYSYDLLDNLTEVELLGGGSGEQQLRTFQYDGVGRLKSASGPERGSYTVTAYDPSGLPLEQMDASGTTLLYEYDGAGRITAVRTRAFTSPGQPTAPVRDLTINSYDVGTGATAGRLVQVQSFDDNGTWTHVRNLQYLALNGRPSYDIQSFNGWTGGSASIGYSYNNFGLLDTITYPEGMTGKGGAFSARYVYQNGALKRVEDPVTLGTHAMATFNAAGAFEEILTWGGYKTRITPDVMNRPSQIVIGPWNYTLNDFSTRQYDSGAFQYDGAGNIGAMGANRYGYDAAMRMVESETYADVYRRQAYGYDDFGNMTEKNMYNSTGTLWAHDQFDVTPPSGGNRNRIYSFRQLGDTTDRLFTYDAQGNLTHSDTQSARFDYLYDVRGRMLASQLLVASGAKELSRFDYNNDANRVRRIDRAHGLVTFFVREQSGRLLSEFRNPENEPRMPEWTKHYIYLGDRLVSLRENKIPSSPGQLRATTTRQGNSASVVLSWEANAPEDHVTSYKLYRAIESTNPSWTVVTTTSNLTFTDSVTIGTRYQYQLTAVGSGGEGYGSRTLVVEAGETVAPSTPTGLAVAGGDRRVDLSWSANATAEQVVGYYVYRGPSGTTNSTRITASAVTSPRFTDLEVSNGIGYRYLVSAVDIVGLESLLSPALETTPHDASPPGPARNVFAIADCMGTSSIQISWDPDAWTSDVARYFVYRQPAFSNQAGLPAGARDAGVNLSYTDTETTPGSTYRYQVVTRDTGGNDSTLSLDSGATARYPAGVVATPATPSAASGDGVVKVRIPVASYSSTLPWLRIYRKANAAKGCASYEFLSQIARNGGGAQPYSEYTDSSAPNNAAYDYVVTTVDSQNRESVFSTAALGIPLAHPQGYTACVEDLGQTWKDGATWCSDSQGGRYSRVVLRWDPPEGRPYQPFLATNAEGTLGYLKGYRIYNYHRDLEGTWPDLNRYDVSKLSAQPVDRDKSYCKNNPDVSCLTSADCPGPTPLCVNDGTSTDYGLCSPSGAQCMVNGDCPTGEQCANAPSDPFLLKFGDARAFTTFGYVSFGYDCLSARAVYKVYANGNWLTLESGYSDNFDVNEKYDPITRCDANTPYVCSGGPGTEEMSWICPSPKQQPVVPRAPTATALAGGVTVSWNPPPGECEPATRNYCWTDCAPNDGTCYHCAPSQVCRDCDFSNEECGIPDGVCRSLFQVCDVNGDCPAQQVCQPRADEVAGYQLYISEVDRGSTAEGRMKYHFMPPARFVTLPAGTTQYTLTGLADRANALGTQPYKFAFRVATVDTAGKVSDPSPPTAAISPLVDPGTGAIPAPHSVKTILWTVNDATAVGAKPSQRGFGGIKIAWQGNSTYPTAFRGYRVWRSTLAGGPFCALLKTDPGLGFPVCLDPNANASDSVTTTTDKFLQVYVDKTAAQNSVYYYAVTAVTLGAESPLSAVVSGSDLGHATQPLSPPAYFKAWAPDYGFGGRTPGNYPEFRGIYLRWCANPSQEGVTAYRVYRSSKSLGPYTQIAQLNSNCLDGSRRCEIRSTGVVEAACTPGVTGNCRIVDLTVQQTPNSGDLVQQVDQHVYFYVVSAVSPQGESGYSAENAGWPNYDPLFCETFPSSGIMNCYPRYDPDNSPDIPCGDETSSLRPHVPPSQPLQEWFPLHYVVIGQKKGGGDNGGGPPPPPVAPPTPNASPRFVYFHLDHLGSPRVISDQSALVVSTHHYMPYGEELPSVAQNNTGTRQFTGQERDPETGMDYMLGRYYGPTLGRFASPDPLSFHSLDAKQRERFKANPQRWNQYTYALDNPMGYTDPDGNAPTPSVKPKKVKGWLEMIFDWIFHKSNPIGVHDDILDAAKIAIWSEIMYLRPQAMALVAETGGDPEAIDIAQSLDDLLAEIGKAKDEFDLAKAQAKLDALKLRLEKLRERLEEEKKKKQQQPGDSPQSGEGEMGRPRLGEHGDCLGGWSNGGYPYKGSRK